MIRNLFMAACAVATLGVSAQKYGYTSVPGDPMQVRIYTLDNGLTVYLSKNDDAPRVQTMVSTRAGSKHDPHDATGLAHYLEHMLFKGTSKIATVDWAKEAPLLLQISNLYEQRRSVTDEAERDRLYARIDSLSGLAARYAVANEYDRMVSSIGARGTNAYTSNEETVYINDIPTDELEKWMALEAERFQELVLRLFHTELETVYEEFNTGQDNDYRKAFKTQWEALFPTHPYGQQTTIGTGEHLKNPSMEKIHQYFKKYYVPNNMAIVIVGDIDHDKTIALIDKYFGKWAPREVPAFTFTPEVPITQVKEVEVLGPMAGWVDIGWRLDGTGSADDLVAELTAAVLNNGQAGLFDLALIQEQRVLEASASSYFMRDYGIFGVDGSAKQGQTLEQVRALLEEQVERLRKGDFDAWLLQAAVNDLRQSKTRASSESNRARASMINRAFIQGRDWKESVERYDNMAKLTKEDVVRFAQERLPANACVVLYKRTGEDPNVMKVVKPVITPVEINREAISEWRKDWDKLASSELTPVFVDYDKAIQRGKLRSGVPVARVANTGNGLFNLRYIVDMGTNHDRELGLAVQYLPYLGTSKLSPAAIQQEFFKLGLSYNVNVADDRVYVTLSGLEQNLAAGVKLFESLLADAKAEPAALQELINDIAKDREDALSNKNAVLYTAMFNYARYGEKSPFRDRLTVEQMRAIAPEALVAKIKGLLNYEHSVLYYGSKPLKEVVALLDKEHVAKRFIPVPPARTYKELETTTNSVIFVDHDMVQTELLMVSKAGAFDQEKLPFISLFGEYFGSGLSSIVFQEIREAKALAYGAGAGYTVPQRKDQAHYVRAFIGTQADKLGDAVDAMLQLMNDMPVAEDQFNGAKTAALKVIASDRITRERIYWTWDQNRQLGLTKDLRQFNNERIPAISVQDLKAFFDKEVKGRNYTYLVIGKASNVDFTALEKLGPVRRMTKEEVFGYSADQQ